MGLSVRPPAGILVVCTANQARSPLAAALLRHHLAELPDSIERRSWWPVVSAGLDAVPGRPLLPSMQKAMARRRMPPFVHASRPLAEADVVSARLIVTMTEDHRRRITRMHPAAIPRTYTLKELDRLLSSTALPHGPGSSDDIVRRLHESRPFVVSATAAEDVADPALGSGRLADSVLSDLIDLVGRVVAGLMPSPAAVPTPELMPDT